MEDLSPYTVVLFVHVLSAIVLVGEGLWSPLVDRRIRHAATLGEIRLWIDLSERMSKWNPLAALVLLGSGVYLGSFGWWTQAWFYVAAAAWLADTLLAAAIVNPTLAAMARRAGQSAELLPDDLLRMRLERKWPLARAAMLANDLAILWVMFAKPGLAGSLLVLAAANVIAVGITVTRHSASRAAAAAPAAQV